MARCPPCTWWTRTAPSSCPKTDACSSRSTDESEQVQRFIRIGSEGYDNDGDGRINEDDIGGPDPNRNYPFAWTLQAGWPYTMSESETRNAYEFMRTHDNIFATFHYHNTGRLIMSSGPGSGAGRSPGPASHGRIRPGWKGPADDR